MDNNAGNPYSSSSYFRPPTERPRSNLTERGFSLNTHHGYDQGRALMNERPMMNGRPMMNDSTASLDDFDRNLFGYDNSSRQHQAEQGRARLSIPPRGVNYDSQVQSSASHAFGMQGLHSRPQRQPIVPTQRHQQPSNMLDAGYPEPTGIFHGAPRFSQMQPQRQQITPPFNVGGFAYSPVNPQAAPARSSSPAATSSPSAKIVQRRVSQQVPLNSHRRAPVEIINGDMDESEYTRAPVTPERQTAIPATENRAPQMLALGHAPPIIQGIQLISPHELPDRFRQVFPYPLFNAVQSKCFPSVFKTNENVVVSAPTGSGKTAILELAICKLVEGFDPGRVKIIYLAPTKSLCAERVRDWEKKFRHVNLPCALLTGDTETSEMKAVGAAAIIVTTPEKWDSITRKWKDHNKLLEMVKLVLVDEVHILKDTRGATLEAIVSRMKAIGSNIRFVALSATIPNSQDVATWLGRDHTNNHIPAHRETFGEDFRPVKLQKHVHGFESNSNDFAFDSVLDSKLPPLVAKYTHKKPMMVFCFTRKSCEKTAQTLAEWWEKCRDNDRAWPAPTQRHVVANKELNKLMSCGVAFHHAGLDAQDRSVIEKAFLSGQIHVICCTSTLAVGVNLPCHLVVIKNTVGYQDGGKLMEYSGLEVMQMLGRAGRPQFDDSAVAIIMTRNDKVDRYKKMVSGQEILESTLHLNLIEHLNSEVGLGTINNVHSAKRWLSSTFLAVRMRQNPNYYKLDGVTDTRDVDEKLEQVCERDINLLLQIQLISDNGGLDCTEYGFAMSRYMVPFETMKLLLSVPPHAKMSQILHIIAQASEFNEGFRMKPNERAAFRELNKSPLMKWPIKETVTSTAHKVSIMIQAQLAGVELPTDKNVSLNRLQYASERRLIFEAIQRLLKCFIDCRAYDCDAVSTRNALELTRSVGAEYWENSPMQLRQIPGVGPAAVRRFIGANINSIEKIRDTEPSDIERIMSKNPPFGRRLRDSLTDFPRLTLKAEFMRPEHRRQGDLVKMGVKAHLGMVNSKAASWNHKKVAVTFMAEVSDGTLVNFWRGSLHMLQRTPDVVFDAVISTPEDTITCTLACDEIVGTVQEVVLEPNLPPSFFPPPKAKPPQRKISGPKNTSRKVADKDEFGSDDFDESELIAAVKQVESSGPVRSSRDEDGFEDIDNFDSPPSSKTSARSLPEPEMMSNGLKWKCNHECADGALTKSGGHCKHLCCREGLDKPRKRVAPKSATKKKNTSDENKSHDEKTLGKGATKSNKKKASEPKLRVASRADQEKHLKMPTEVIDLVDRPSTFGGVEYAAVAPRDYRKLHGLHESVQKGNSIKIPKSTATFSYAAGAKPDLPFLKSKDKGSRSDVFGEDDDFGSENSDDFDLPSPTRLFKERLEVTTPLPRPAFKSGAAPTNYDEFEDSVASIEAGTTGTQDFIPTSEASKAKTAPKMTQSFEDDCFDFGAFDNNDYDYPVYVPPASQNAVAEPYLASGDGNSSSPKQKSVMDIAEDTPAVKYRRVTRDDKINCQPADLVLDLDTSTSADQDENAQGPTRADVDTGAAENGDADADGDLVTFTFGGNNVRKRKREGNRDSLPDWVLRDCPPDFYDEYGDYINFV